MEEGRVRPSEANGTPYHIRVRSAAMEEGRVRPSEAFFHGMTN